MQLMHPKCATILDANMYVHYTNTSPKHNLKPPEMHLKCINKEPLPPT